VITVEAEDNL